MSGRATRGPGAAVLLAVLLALYPRLFLIELIRIPSASMAPTLVAGDLVLVDRFSIAAGCEALIVVPCRPPRVGDVVVFHAPPIGLEGSFVKRVVATEGSVVDFVDKGLWRDGDRVPEPWVIHLDPVTYPDVSFVPDAQRMRDQHGPTRVPARALFVVGDNRDESWDSRYWGPLAIERVHGRLVLALGDSAATGAPLLRWVD